MSEKHTLAAVTAQFTVACNLFAVYVILTTREDIHSWFFPWALLAFAPLIYVLNRLFLRRKQTLQTLWLLNAAAGIAFVALCCWADGLSGLLHRLPMMAFFTVWLIFKGVNSALDGPKLNGMLLCLDGSILALVLFTAYSAASGLEPVWNIPSICGFAAAILGMTARRSSRAFGWKEWGFMAVAFGLIFAAMWLLVGLVAAPAGSGLVALWNTLVQIAAFVGLLVLRFLQFLSSLFSTPQDPGELAASGAPIIIPEMEASEGSPILGIIVMGLLLVLVAFCIVQLVRKLGGRRIGGKTTKAVSAHQRTRPSLGQALRKLFAQWKQKLLRQKFLWAYRNTAVGLYFILVRRCRITPWHKLPGETPREFLNRLRRGVCSDVQLSESIAQLIPAVDAALYGGSSLSQSFPQAPRIRRQIGNALQRQALQDGLHRSKGETSAV